MPKDKIKSDIPPEQEQALKAVAITAAPNGVIVPDVTPAGIHDPRINHKAAEKSEASHHRFDKKPHNLEHFPHVVDNVDDNSDASSPTNSSKASETSSYNPFRQGANHGPANQTPRPHLASSISATSAAKYASRIGGRGLPHSVEEEEEHLGQELDPLPTRVYEAIERIFQGFHPKNSSSSSNNTIARRDPATESKRSSDEEKNTTWDVLEQKIIDNLRHAITNIPVSVRSRQISQLLKEAQQLEMLLSIDVDDDTVDNVYVDFVIKAAAYATQLERIVHPNVRNMTFNQLMGSPSTWEKGIQDGIQNLKASYGTDLDTYFFVEAFNAFFEEALAMYIAYIEMKADEATESSDSRAPKAPFNPGEKPHFVNSTANNTSIERRDDPLGRTHYTPDLASEEVVKRDINAKKAKAKKSESDDVKVSTPTLTDLLSTDIKQSQAINATDVVPDMPKDLRGLFNGTEMKDFVAAIWHKIDDAHVADGNFSEATAAIAVFIWRQAEILEALMDKLEHPDSCKSTQALKNATEALSQHEKDKLIEAVTNLWVGDKHQDDKPKGKSKKRGKKSKLNSRDVPGSETNITSIIESLAHSCPKNQTSATRVLTADERKRFHSTIQELQAAGPFVFPPATQDVSPEQREKIEKLIAAAFAAQDSIHCLNARTENSTQPKTKSHNQEERSPSPESSWIKRFWRDLDSGPYGQGTTRNVKPKGGWSTNEKRSAAKPEPKSKHSKEPQPYSNRVNMVSSNPANAQEDTDPDHRAAKTSLKDLHDDIKNAEAEAKARLIAAAQRFVEGNETADHPAMVASQVATAIAGHRNETQSEKADTAAATAAAVIAGQKNETQGAAFGSAAKRSSIVAAAMVVESGNDA